MLSFFLTRFLLTRLTHFPRLAGLLLLAAATSCTAPRALIQSGKVTPVGEIRGGTNLIFNIPTATVGALGDITADAVRGLQNQDSVGYLQNATVLRNFQRGALAYALDPLGTTQDIYLRYGIAPRFDAGIRYAAGAVIADVQYQFMGSTGSWRKAGDRNGANASVGLLFSTQSADLPGREALNVGGSLLDFGARRTDVLVPLTFSTPLGTEEEFGHLAAGLVLGFSTIHYQFEPTNLFRDRAGSSIAEKVPSIDERKNFLTGGAFVNGKFGYRYVYVVPALSIYYQNYGTFQLLNDQKASLSGVTFVPSLGLQICIPTKRAR